MIYRLPLEKRRRCEVEHFLSTDTNPYNLLVVYAGNWANWTKKSIPCIHFDIFAIPWKQKEQRKNEIHNVLQKEKYIYIYIYLLRNGTENVLYIYTTV